MTINRAGVLKIGAINSNFGTTGNRRAYASRRVFVLTFANVSPLKTAASAVEREPKMKKVLLKFCRKKYVNAET